MNDIEVTVFDKPSGNIIALVAGSIPRVGKRSHFRANAMVFIDRPPEVTITTSRALTLAEMAQSIDMMQRFESQLHALAAAYGPRDALVEPSSSGAIRKAATTLVRHHLDSVEVHPCDVHDDEVRARHCIREVQDLHTALQR
ncbi:hypothetical protein WJ96_05565 [Burkholderia ubonensis]|uniref:Uncharacterized protein n=1 Tax=Burkholderia ubonensis TaxID=101571 RepID=A0AAW3MYY9_9BURK|nr:hypothetical protein [Burkholderia ubonensis]KVP75224.1 hypothetical protein WJ93_07360 [Burkholderia ubonensis]KVP96695.1 hypothetical protein WJ97_12500 [Burkholderia ubonensis]KVP98037.1 hypothetical protein WJ96_05565 [Burkholderia ubonensis]KVZ92734.1 hypothetical protein WL25_17225 [Burkholderia ubonensis]